MHRLPVELIDLQVDIGFGFTREAEHRVAQRITHYLCGQKESISWIGVSMLSNAPIGLKVVQELHTALPDTPIVLGGYFPSVNYEFILSKFPFVSTIIRGDGESGCLQISRTLCGGNHLDPKGISNAAWIAEGTLHAGRIRPAAQVSLPVLDTGLLRNPRAYQVACMITSRGCPFKCNYCIESDIRRYAEFPPEWVDKQLTNIKSNMGNRFVVVSDPIFGVNTQRTLALCDVLAAHRLHYFVGSRVDVLKPELVPSLRRCGIELVFLGMESASAGTLVRMNKIPSETAAPRYLAKARELLSTCFRNDLTAVVGLMLAYPGDSEDDLRATLEFVKETGKSYDQAKPRRSGKGGFVASPEMTHIYAGSQLFFQTEKQLPRSEPTADSNEREWDARLCIGGLSAQGAGVWKAAMERESRMTAYARKQMGKFFAFSTKEHVNGHPELIDNEGVATLSSSIRALA